MKEPGIQPEARRGGSSRLLLFLDSAIVLLNASNSYSILPYLLFAQYYRAINTFIITCINLGYLLFRFGSGRLLLGVENPLFVLYVLINVLNIYFGALTDTLGWGMAPFLFANTTFYLILLNLFDRYKRLYSFDKSFWLVVRGYIWLCALGIASVVSVFLVVQCLGIDPRLNLVNDRMDLFKYNLEANVYRDYYFPFRLGILQSTRAIKVPFFQEYGIITGLFHEGHTSTFVVIPSILLLLRVLKRRVSRYTVSLLYLLAIVIAASTTNVLSLLACLLVFVMMELRRSVALPVLYIAGVGVFLLMIEPMHYTFIMNKLGSRSAEYSMSTIAFAFKPRTLVGTNFFNLTYWDEPDSRMNVGYVIFVLNVLFLNLFIYKTGKINLSKDRRTRFVGLFILYFLLHSMKIAMVTYSLSYLLLVLFMIEVHTGRRYDRYRRTGEAI